MAFLLVGYRHEDVEDSVMDGKKLAF